MKNYLKIAGNVHLSYYLEAADKLGIKFEMVAPTIARFEHEGNPWFIINTVTPLNSTPSSTLARRKHMTYKILQHAGIPVAEQTALHTPDHAVDFYNRYHGDIVIKPVRNLGGKGVSVFPGSEKDTKKAFKDALKKNLSETNTKVIGEKFYRGGNYRLLVVGDKVIAAAYRRPASVLGDGKSTIKELIQLANEDRKTRLLKSIKVDKPVKEHLKRQNISLKTVPAENEWVALRLNANQTTGGTTEECMAEVHPKYKELAVKACKVMGMKLGGVDLITEDITTPEVPHIINEINYNPGLRIHYKPDVGEIVEVALPIMEYMKDNIC